MFWARSRDIRSWLKRVLGLAQGIFGAGSRFLGKAQEFFGAGSRYFWPEQDFLGLAQDFFALAQDILGLAQGILRWFNIFLACPRYFGLVQDIFG